MESAQDFIDRYFDGRLKLSGELANMLSDRDAKIRKECADRAVEWQKKLCKPDDWSCNNCTGCSDLRAAILGEKKED